MTYFVLFGTVLVIKVFIKGGRQVTYCAAKQNERTAIKVKCLLVIALC